jgi:membrane protease YdiL (CAAX protease family)
MIWTAARVLLIVAAIAVLVIVPLYAQSSDGSTALLPVGVVIDAIAIIVLATSMWSLWRERRSST